MFSVTEKTRIRRMPMTKLGRLTPMIERNCNPSENHLPRWIAVMTPRGTPTTSEMIVAISTSSIVAGKRSAIRLITSCWLR